MYLVPFSLENFYLSLFADLFIALFLIYIFM